MVRLQATYFPRHGRHDAVSFQLTTNSQGLREYCTTTSIINGRPRYIMSTLICPPSPRPSLRDELPEHDADSITLFPDDALSEGDMTDGYANQNNLVLPQPEIGNLEEIEGVMRGVAITQNGREAICKFVIHDDYVRKLIPLVEMAEDLESLKDLHCLCNIMKMIILLNDSQIIDHIVNENVVMGVVGALECELEILFRRVLCLQDWADIDVCR